MIRNFTLFFLAIILLASCTDTKTKLKAKEEIICRNWQEIAYSNSEMENQFRMNQAFIDTFGKSTTPDQNLHNYGFTNVDSARKEMQLQMDRFNAEQKMIVQHTRFEFRKDSTMDIISGNFKSTSDWKLENDHFLVLQDRAIKGKDGEIRAEIITLTDDSLKIKITDQGGIKSASFVPVKK